MSNVLSGVPVIKYLLSEVKSIPFTTISWAKCSFSISIYFKFIILTYPSPPAIPINKPSLLMQAAVIGHECA